MNIKLLSLNFGRSKKEYANSTQDNLASAKTQSKLPRETDKAAINNLVLNLINETNK